MTTFFESVNPYTGETVNRFDLHTSSDLHQMISTGHHAYLAWKKTSFEFRTDLLQRLAHQLETEKMELAQLISTEMGKPIKESWAEIDKCVGMIRHYALFGPEALQPVTVTAATVKSYISYQPMGIILGIMPWNFPLWQVLRFAIPTLLGGNVILIKPAPNVVGASLALERIFQKVGFPIGIFHMILIDTPAIEQVISSPEVRGVTLTGSMRAGAAVASLAGKYIKKSVLELGGSDALLVLPDADIDTAATAAVASRFQNAGQTCIAAKRWLVHQEVKESFLHAVLTRLKVWTLGNPLDESTHMGPVARPDLAANLSRQLAMAQEQGAVTHITGDHRFCQFYPTVLEVNTPNHIAFQEEFFGPIATIMEIKSDEEAIDLANATAFGLGASLWTRDLEKAERLASQLDVGTVAVNQGVKSDVRLPFGGTKNSGYGRELGVLGLHEFMNIQSVWIEP